MAQRQITKDFFDQVAHNWSAIAYDPKGKFLNFPMSAVRQAVTFDEMKRMKAGNRVLDIGCGTGELVVDLVTRGYDAYGFDVSAKMIEQAKGTAKKKLKRADAGERFFVADGLDLKANKKYDAVTSMGVLEYIQEEPVYLDTVKSVLKEGGLAFIEVRNRLFNAVTANKYTLEAAAAKDLEALVAQLARVAKYSPAQETAAEAIVADVYRTIGRALSKDSGPVEAEPEDQLQDYPLAMVRRQHTPEELDATLKKAGLRLRHVVYYHCHPFLPVFEKAMPRVYNQIAYLMQPLGYTPIGAAISSAFVAVIERP